MNARIVTALLASLMLPACVDDNPESPDLGTIVEPEPTPSEPEPTPSEPEPTPSEPEPTPSEPEPTEPEPTEPEPPAPAVRLVTDFELIFEDGTHAVEGPVGSTHPATLNISAYTEHCDDCRVQIILNIGEHFECAFDGVTGPAPGLTETVNGDFPIFEVGEQAVRFGATMARDCEEATEQARSGAVDLEDVATMTGLRSQFALNDVNIAGQGVDAKIAIGSTFDVALAFEHFVRDCPGCLAQVVVGIDGASQGCAYAGIPGDSPIVDVGTLRMRAPQVEGRYAITVGRALEFSCGDALAGRREQVIGHITVVAPNGRTLQLRHSGSCLDIDGASHENQARVIQWPCTGNNNQRFIFAKWENENLWQIRSVDSEKCVDIRAAGQQNGALVQQYDCVNQGQQKFDLHSVDGGLKLRAAHSGKCLDLLGASRENGVQLGQWNCIEGDDHQLFDFGE